MSGYTILSSAEEASAAGPDSGGGGLQHPWDVLGQVNRGHGRLLQTCRLDC